MCGPQTTHMADSFPGVLPNVLVRPGTSDRYAILYLHVQLYIKGSHVRIITLNEVVYGMV